MPVLSAYPPPGESAQDLATERVLFAGGMLVMLGYGFYVSLTGACVYLMLFSSPRRPSWFIIAYIVVLSIGATLFTGTNWQWSQNLFIENRGYPGGPSQYFVDVFDDWVNTFSNAVMFFNSIVVDSLMLWRTYLIYDYRKRVIVIPVLWLMGTTVLSVLTLIQTATPNSNPYQAVQFVIPYFGSSIALNLAMTLMIAGRLIYIRKRLSGPLGGSSPYLSLASMLIESSALYSITGIITIVAFASGSDAAVFMVPILGEVMCIAPMLILLRVGFGSAYTRSRARWNSSAYVSSVSDMRGQHSMQDSVARPAPIFLRQLSTSGPSSDALMSANASQANLHYKFPPPPPREHTIKRKKSDPQLLRG
ncbi:hypothetical protein EXIGLDRAFT_762918 [Exidia glandulosa HHB12029]|uniref:Uncharacterized protein n=1 Tax=Exidia glandulosa HHB12029 TaxID=1314781 RepID=A0A165MEE2_EXIGL|nr:hypothetical protein EXIGLDRAFT_762918 [Exidia glandulosa HHB12029]